MILMYVVRHKSTGVILKDLKGASHWDPEGLTVAPEARAEYTANQRADTRPPRLFISKRAADNFMTSWARGAARMVSNETYRGAGGYMTDEAPYDLVVEPVPGRARDQLEILPVTLTFGEPL